MNLKNREASGVKEGKEEECWIPCVQEQEQSDHNDPRHACVY